MAVREGVEPSTSSLWGRSPARKRPAKQAVALSAELPHHLNQNISHSLIVKSAQSEDGE